MKVIKQDIFADLTIFLWVMLSKMFRNWGFGFINSYGNLPCTKLLIVFKNKK